MRFGHLKSPPVDPQKSLHRIDRKVTSGHIQFGHTDQPARHLPVTSRIRQPALLPSSVTMKLQIRNSSRVQCSVASWTGKAAMYRHEN